MLSQIGIHASVDVVFPPERLRDELADVGPEVAVVETDGVADCDGLVTFAYEDAFLSADLRWLHSTRAGVDEFPLEVLSEHDIRLTNSTGIHSDVVGDTVAGFMLQFARGLHRYRSNQERGEWERLPWDRPFALAGESLCVVGLGTLGRGIAARADALGMDVVGVKRTPMPVDHVDEVYPRSDLHEAIGDARFVALAVPLTDETEGMFGAAEFERMRDDAYFINVARGPVADEAALIDALESGEIAGAGLDVFETEPLPADSPLWDMENVILTPHVAAMTGDYYRRVADLVRENVRRFADGESLANAVV